MDRQRAESNRIVWVAFGWESCHVPCMLEDRLATSVCIIRGCQLSVGLIHSRLAHREKCRLKKCIINNNQVR